MALGRKTGGRKKGVANRRTQEIADKAAANGLLPLDYLLGVMRDEGIELAVRMEAAKAAAPFLHHRLQSTETKIEGLMTYEKALTELADKG
jgi:hypothetical protein